MHEMPARAVRAAKTKASYWDGASEAASCRTSSSISSGMEDIVDDPLVQIGWVVFLRWLDVGQTWRSDSIPERPSFPPDRRSIQAGAAEAIFSRAAAGSGSYKEIPASSRRRRSRTSAREWP